MASTSQKQKKGILKDTDSEEPRKKEIEWDEMNILATYHPADKDYGHMKVDEPPTPFINYIIDSDEDIHKRRGSANSTADLDLDILAQRLETRSGSSVDRKYYQDEDDDDDFVDYSNMTEEEIKQRKAFLLKRKKHYNEFAASQLAKKLIADEEDEEDNDDSKSEHDDKQGINKKAHTSRSSSDSHSVESSVHSDSKTSLKGKHHDKGSKKYGPK